jgi:predicted phosphodiesterase
VRVAALYDIHGNLPALEAVLAEVEAAAPDLVVVGGDVVAGPLPAETLERLVAVGDRVRWVMGNADRKVVEAYDRGGRPEDPEDAIDRLDAWVARHLTRTQRDRLAAFEPLVRAEVDGLGPVLFCHGSPRSDEEIITAVSPEERLAPMLDAVAVAAAAERMRAGGLPGVDELMLRESLLEPVGAASAARRLEAFATP